MKQAGIRPDFVSPQCFFFHRSPCAPLATAFSQAVDRWLENSASGGPPSCGILPFWLKLLKVAGPLTSRCFG